MLRPADFSFSPVTHHKMLSLQYNSIEQCFAAYIVHSCQQYWIIDTFEPESRVTM